MTIPFPLDAFDAVKEVKPRRAAPRLPSDKLASLGIALAFHVVIVGAFVAGLKVAAPMLREVKVTVDVIQPSQKPDDLVVSAPKLAAPAIVTAPMPVIAIAPAPEAIAAAPPRIQAPPAPPAPPAAKPGETRSSYLGRLLAQLNRFKHYPPSARAAHIEGVVMVHFVMARSGKLLSAEIAQSSGRAVLDREALALMRRAEPLPPMPETLTGEVLDAVVPVDFSLHG
jgi:protein TonB